MSGSPWARTQRNGPQKWQLEQLLAVAHELKGTGNGKHRSNLEGSCADTWKNERELQRDVQVHLKQLLTFQDSRRRHRSPPTDHPPPIPARIHVAADAFRRLVAADAFRLDLLLDATDPRRRLALNRSPSPPSSRRLALAIVSPQGIADEVYLAKDYIHVIAWVSTSLISFA
ncbi:hypothetical protein OsI_28349 [Oryza sativa Indica Group]|uniref:Uncharacterized protein n=1 Tax=Oryza sativa subsp. indica TaxID=39946 RepID=B8BC71_ORYSI|nr:hypothetical protein OsI_28349 [Oryza sativa Indica Group]